MTIIRSGFFPWQQPLPVLPSHATTATETIIDSVLWHLPPHLCWQNPKRPARAPSTITRPSVSIAASVSNDCFATRKRMGRKAISSSATSNASAKIRRESWHWHRKKSKGNSHKLYQTSHATIPKRIANENEKRIRRLLLSNRQPLPHPQVSLMQ